MESVLMVFCTKNILFKGDHISRISGFQPSDLLAIRQSRLVLNSLYTNKAFHCLFDFRNVNIKTDFKLTINLQIIFNLYYLIVFHSVQPLLELHLAYAEFNTGKF